MNIPKEIEFGFDIARKEGFPKLIQQVHGGTIYEYGLAQKTDGSAPEADALLTRQSNANIFVFTADCLPVLLFDPHVTTHSPIAAIHCGWRSARFEIVRKTVLALGTPNMSAVLGPCILSCCFEVKADLIQAFRERSIDITKFLINRTHRIYFDLVAYICSEQLKGVDICLDYVKCTSCNASKFPSYRRDKITNPSIRSWIKKLPLTKSY